ncbi:hypothetical protein HNO89_003716 [Sporosarcina luteola]|nr:hypothetical protein [Sporosarcina luteola]
MNRLLCMMLVSFILLAGCQRTPEITTADTPEEALERFQEEENFAKAIEIYGTVEISNERVISAYKGVMGDKEEVFVANIEKQRDAWVVTDAIGMGTPSEEQLDQSTGTAKFRAGFADGDTVVNEDWKIIKMDGGKYSIWIEVY